MKNISILATLLVLLSCGTKPRTKEEVLSLPFEDMFLFAYRNQDSPFFDTLCATMQDSLAQYPNHILKAKEFVDSSQGCIRLAFDFYEVPEYDVIWDIKERNTFILLINKENRVLAKGKPVKSIDSLNLLLEEYIGNPSRLENLPEFTIKQSHLLGKVEVSKQNFDIQADILPHNCGSWTSWSKLFEILSAIENSYLNIRNLTSQSYFSKDFKYLEFNQKLAVAELWPIRIQLFGRPESMPPLPRLLPKPEIIDEIILKDKSIENEL